MSTTRLELWDSPKRSRAHDKVIRYKDAIRALDKARGTEGWRKRLEAMVKREHDLIDFVTVGLEERPNRMRRARREQAKNTQK